MPVPLGLLLAPMIAQAGLGGFQLFKGIRDSKNVERPDYQIPQGMVDALASIQEQMGQKYMPGEQVGRQLENEVLSGALSQLLSSSSSAGDISQALTSVYGQQMRNEASRTQNRAEYFDSLNDTERSLLMEMAKYQDKEFEIDKMMKFQDEAGAASALQGSGIQNMMGALSSLSMMGMMGAFDGSGGGVGDVGTRSDMTPMASISPASLPVSMDKSLATSQPSMPMNAQIAQSLTELFKSTIPNYNAMIQDSVNYQMNPQ